MVISTIFSSSSASRLLDSGARRIFSPTLLRLGRVMVCTTLLLAAPAAAHAGRVTLTWDPSPDPSITGYVVYYGTLSRTYTASYQAGTATTAVIQGLSPGVRYYFVVKAFKGSSASPDSNEVDAFASNTPPTVVNPGTVTRKQGLLSLAVAASDADGDPLTFSATGLPPGVSINSATGTISGTASPGAFSPTVTVSDGQAHVAMTFALTISLETSPTIDTPPSQTHQVNDVVNLQLRGSDADGDVVTFSATGLPPGLTVNATSGVIAGYPTTPGTYSVTVRASDGTRVASASFSWTVTAPAPGAPIAHWRLDEGSGTAAADVGGRTGTLRNGAQWVAGRMGSAVQFDGVDDYLTLPAFDVTGSGITLSAWVRNTSFASGVDQRFISKATDTSEGGHYWMIGTTTVNGAPRLRFRLRTGSTTTTLIASSGALALNTWYHAVATYDGVTMRLFLNGVQVGSVAKSGTVATNASVPVHIARNPDGASFTYMRGALDDVRVYNRGLSAAEIAAVAVEDGNRAPAIVDPGSRTTREGPFSMAISAMDADGDALAFTATGLCAGLTINSATGVIAGTAHPGAYTVTVTASDGKTQTSASFNLDVAADLPPTMIAPGDQTHDTDAMVALALVAADPEGDPLAFNATGLPPGLSMNASTGQITGRPAEMGVFPVALTASDAMHTVSAAFTWTIVPTPDFRLAAHWLLDESTGTSTTDAIAGRVGTLSNGALRTTGRHGRAVWLDGVDDHVATNPFDLVGPGVTLSAWVRSASLAPGVDQRFIVKGIDGSEDGEFWSLGTATVSGVPRLRFRLKLGATTTTLTASGGVLRPNVWYLATATYDGAAMRLYLNGLEVGAAAVSGGVATHATAAVILGRAVDGTGAMHGAIDDVRLYSRALSSREINDLVGIIPDESPLLADPGPQATREGFWSLALSAVDPEGAPIAYAATGLPAGVTVDPASGVISGNVVPGTFTVTVTASDGTSQPASASFTLTVAANEAPVISAPASQTHALDAMVTIAVSAVDPEGDRLTFIASGLPAGVQINAETGVISGRLTVAGDYTVTVAVSDGQHASSATFAWRVTAPVPAGLQAHWTFDEGYGSVVEDVVGDRLGTLVNGTQWAPGRLGSAIAFDGVNDYVAVPPFDITGSAMTVSGWVKISSFPSGVDQRFVSKATNTYEGGHYWMVGTTHVNGAPRLRFRLRTGSRTTTLIASGGTLKANVWYHVAATYDGSAMRLYLNGVEVGKVAKTGKLATNGTVPVHMGRNPDGASFTYMRGALDDLRIYNRGLSAAEVAALASGN